MLAGKTALVTGANGAIGSEISRTLAKEGAHVIVNYFEDRAGAEALASAIGGVAIYADIGNSDDVEKMIAGFPRIDILVNNTGIQTFGPLLDVLEADWDRVIRTNLKGCFLCTQRIGRIMKQNGSGRIINLGSGSNKTAFPGLSPERSGPAPDRRRRARSRRSGLGSKRRTTRERGRNSRRSAASERPRMSRARLSFLRAMRPSLLRDKLYGSMEGCSASLRGRIEGRLPVGRRLQPAPTRAGPGGSAPPGACPTTCER